MQSINLSYAQYYKRKYQHIGHFWQDRFKSYIVEDDDYLITVGKYIEVNALRAGLVKRPEEYEYSSYNFYACGRDCGVILTPDPWYIGLSEDLITRRHRYQEFILADIIEPKIIKSQFIGSEDFVARLIKEKFKERIKHKRGRPRKNPKELIYNLL
jgi:putative transposase